MFQWKILKYLKKQIKSSVLETCQKISDIYEQLKKKIEELK